MLIRSFLFAIAIFNLSAFAESSAHFVSTQETKEHFSLTKERFEQRWEAFQKDRKFKPYEMGKTDAALTGEFEEILDTRQKVWATPGFEIAENLMIGDYVRAPGCVAFGFNNTVLNYNASTIYMEDKVYIACEGPRSKDIPNFFQLLTTHHVTHLVRLTDSYEGETKKCHPYWDGLLAHLSDGADSLNIPRETGVYTVRAFQMAHWRDNSGVAEDELLDMVCKIRQELKDTDGFLAVHCSAGVGRTGTFLAALSIVDAIDRGIPFSIEEIVYRLSLQRVHSVSRTAQYMTLHRLADRYLDQLALEKAS